jgi:bacteriocin-like protein
LSNENERELTDEELEQVLGGVCIGDVNVANITSTPITVQALNGTTVNVVPQVPINVVNTSV